MDLMTRRQSLVLGGLDGGCKVLDEGMEIMFKIKILDVSIE